MSKKNFFDKDYLIIFIFILILIIYVSVSYYSRNTFIENSIEKEKENKQNNILYHKIISLENHLKKTSEKVDKYEDNLKKTSEKVEKYDNNATNKQVINYPTSVINRDPKELNALDRIYNPIRYPYKSDYFYDQNWYPNLELPFQVIGGGYRNTPTLGGTQIPIYNPPAPLSIDNSSISPINITTRGPLGKPQQVGVLYKINGDDNDILPLFGRRRYPNDTIYEYYTLMGQYNVKMNVITKNKNDELGSNDVVFIKGRNIPYRVTIYETDFPQYIPYL
jgi:hypothetical protein